MKIVKFFPHWYKEKIIKYESKRLKNLIFLTLVLNALLIYLLANDIDSIKRMGTSIRKHEEDVKVSAAVKFDPRKNLQLIRTYNEVLQYIKEPVNYMTVDINYNDITVVAVAENMKGFLDFVSSIEQDGKFSIKKITTPETIGTGMKATLILSRK